MIQLRLLLDSLGMSYKISDELLEKKFIAFSHYDSDANSIKREMLLLTDQLRSTDKSEQIVYVAKQIVETTVSFIITDLPVEALCHFLQEAANDFLVWYEQLLGVFQNKGDVSQMIPILNMKLKNPIIIFDASYKLLGYSHFFDVTNDLDWGANITKGYVTFSENRNKKVREILSDNRLLEQGNVYELDEFENRFFSINLRYNRELIGMLTIIEQEEKISNCSIELIKSILYLVEAVAFLNQSKMHSSIKAFEYLLKDLIADSNTSVEEIRDRLYFEKYTLKPSFVVCAIRIKNLATYSFPTIFYANSNIHFIYSEYHVFLLENYSDGLLCNLKRDIKFCLEINETIAGVSNVFDSLVDFKEKYEEAVKAIQFNQSSKKYALYCYRDCLMDDFFNVVSKLKGIEKYLYQPVVNLMEKDKDLYKTLVKYIEQNNSQKLTSLLLEIHRTTLIYRLNKIREDFGVDYSDPKIAFQIMITAKLMKNMDTYDL